MFFEGNRIDAVREMILAEDDAGQRQGAQETPPLPEEGLYSGSSSALEGRPATIRLLDPPLHEFIGTMDNKQIAALSKKIEDQVLARSKPALQTPSTRRTRCSVTAAAVLESSIRRSPRCRPQRSLRLLRTSRRKEPKCSQRSWCRSSLRQRARAPEGRHRRSGCGGA